MRHLRIKNRNRDKYSEEEIKEIFSRRNSSLHKDFVARSIIRNAKSIVLEDKASPISKKKKEKKSSE